MLTNINVGDIVEVTRNDGRKFESFVVRKYPNRNMFYGRVLESSKDKVSTASWERYGLNGNGVCQVLEDCQSVKVIREGREIVVEDLNDTKVYRNSFNGKDITFCISEGYGGWSESPYNEGSAMLESYIGSTHAKALVEKGV